MKVKCIYHEGDDTPSMHLYENSYYCFACSASGPLSELGIKGIGEERTPKYVEDLKATLEYINSLPKTTIRGLTLPSDSEFYYIVWPDQSYYIKRRHHDLPNSPKYVGPAGHKKPLFVVRELGRNLPLIIVEGQINALSLSEANIDANIVSPGGAGDFKQLRNFPYYSVYDNILLVLDNDAPGALGAIELKGHLLAMGKKNVGITLVKEDCNEILQRTGKEGITNWARDTLKSMGLS